VTERRGWSAAVSMAELTKISDHLFNSGGQKIAA
jgi:hypothetical protein